MTDARWKLVVDGQGVTIASDRFQFTTNGANGSRSAHRELAVDEAMFEAVESSQIEAIVSELQTMTKRTYGQFCGLSRALEIVGERWVMLIIRDLLVSPKSAAQLRRGLPRIPDDLLRNRLNELEHTGVVRRGDAAEADDAVYELTEWGSQLEDIALRLGRWGARLLDKPRPEDIVTADGMVTALRATFLPAAAMDVRVGYELRIGDVVVHACVDRGVLRAGIGSLPGADLVIEPGTAFKSLLTGELGPTDALDSGSVCVSGGDPALLRRFVDMFQLPT